MGRAPAARKRRRRMGARQLTYFEDVAPCAAFPHFQWPDCESRAVATMKCAYPGPREVARPEEVETEMGTARLRKWRSRGRSITPPCGRPDPQLPAAFEGVHLFQHRCNQIGGVGGRGCMRRDEDLRVVPQRAGFRQRLDFEHVEACLLQRAVLQRLHDVGVLLQPAAAGIDQHGAAEAVTFPELLEQPVVDDAGGLQASAATARRGCRWR